MNTEITGPDQRDADDVDYMLASPCHPDYRLTKGLMVGISAAQQAVIEYAFQDDYDMEDSVDVTTGLTTTLVRGNSLARMAASAFDLCEALGELDDTAAIY